MTPAEAAAALARCAILDTLTVALEAQAARLASLVREGLVNRPGDIHDEPWQQTGSLEASIGFAVDGLSAEVGSNDPAAIPQELGSVTVPPRPFLAPAAAALGESIASEIGRAIADLIARQGT